MTGGLKDLVSRNAAAADLDKACATKAGATYKCSVVGNTVKIEEGTNTWALTLAVDIRAPATTTFKYKC